MKSSAWNGSIDSLQLILNACGLDTTSKIGGSVQFFIYDTIKIMVLLGVLILIDFVYSKLFPARKNKKDTRQISRDMGKHRLPLYSAP